VAATTPPPPPPPPPPPKKRKKKKKKKKNPFCFGRVLSCYFPGRCERGWSRVPASVFPYRLVPRVDLWRGVSDFGRAELGPLFGFVTIPSKGWTDPHRAYSSDKVRERLGHEQISDFSYHRIPVRRHTCVFSSRSAICVSRSAGMGSRLAQNLDHQSISTPLWRSTESAILTKSIWPYACGFLTFRLSAARATLYHKEGKEPLPCISRRTTLPTAQHLKFCHLFSRHALRPLAASALPESCVLGRGFLL